MQYIDTVKYYSAIKKNEIMPFETNRWTHFLDGASGKEPACQRRRGEGNGTPLQYSCLENPMGGGAW